LVLRERETETFTRPLPERRPRSPSPVRIRERVVERERSPSPVPMERVRTRVVERERERSLTPPPPERLRARVIETRERIRERSPSPIRYRERVVERARSPSPIRVRERIVERERERSPSPPPFERVRTRITERETRAPSPSPSPSPPPPIRAPPIHQEIITHHRHIDHGKSKIRRFLSVAIVLYANSKPAQDSSVPSPPVRLHPASEKLERPISTFTHPRITPRSILPVHHPGPRPDRLLLGPTTTTTSTNLSETDYVLVTLELTFHEKGEASQQGLHHENVRENVRESELISERTKMKLLSTVERMRNERTSEKHTTEQRKIGQLWMFLLELSV
jgi:hypothetical protein